MLPTCEQLSQPPDGSLKALPECPGTILILHSEVELVRHLFRLFAGRRCGVQHYSSFEHLRVSGVPDGPVCLIAGTEKGEKGIVRAYQRFKQKGTHLPVIFLAAECNLPVVVEAMRNGADDFLQVPFAEGELLAAASRALGRSRRFLESDRLRKHDEVRRRVALLSGRQRIILRLVMGGLMNKEIAARLNVALVTVKQNRRAVMQKMGATNLADLARIASIAKLWPGDGDESPVRQPQP